jgi:hypothetical protein
MVAGSADGRDGDLRAAGGDCDRRLSTAEQRPSWAVGGGRERWAEDRYWREPMRPRSTSTTWIERAELPPRPSSTISSSFSVALDVSSIRPNRSAPSGRLSTTISLAWKPDSSENSNSMPSLHSCGTRCPTSTSPRRATSWYACRLAGSALSRHIRGNELGHLLQWPPSLPTPRTQIREVVLAIVIEAKFGNRKLEKEFMARGTKRASVKSARNRITGIILF